MEFKNYQTKLLKFILLSVLVSFPLLGSNCENLLQQAASGDITGSWQLVKMEGNLQDVCLGETATFQSGNATLQCPNAAQRTRQYTFTNNILTYTETNVSYDVSFVTQGNISKMRLSARNSVERILTYNKTSK